MEIHPPQPVPYEAECLQMKMASTFDKPGNQNARHRHDTPQLTFGVDFYAAGKGYIWVCFRPKPPHRPDPETRLPRFLYYDKTVYIVCQEDFTSIYCIFEVA